MVRVLLDLDGAGTSGHAHVPAGLRAHARTHGICGSSDLCSWLYGHTYIHIHTRECVPGNQKAAEVPHVVVAPLYYIGRVAIGAAYTTILASYM